MKRKIKSRKLCLSLMNFKITDEDRKLFQEKANRVTNGNVSALIIKAVKTIPISKFKKLA